MSSIRRKPPLCILLRDRLRAALVEAFREGWQCKGQSDRGECDFAAIIKAWAETIPERIRKMEKGE